MASLLIIAACASPALSFDGEWKAAAVCALALAIEFSVLLWQERRQWSLVGRGLLVLVAVTGLSAVGLALFAGVHATQELNCFGAPFPPSRSPAEVAEMKQAEEAYQTLYTIDTLVTLGYLATLFLALVGAVFLAARNRAVRRVRA